MNKIFKNTRAYIIVFTASLFYLYDFFLRVAPSVLTDELMAFYSVGAGVLGPIISSFFLAYVTMQIPAGLLGDRFGPKKVLIISAIMCSIATILFVSSNSILAGSLSRFLIGCSASFAYIAPLMLASRWFHSKYFALICGIIQMMGCIGAIISGTPILYLTRQYGWQQPMIWAAWLGFVLAILFYFVIKDTPENKDCPEIKNLAESSVLVLSALKKVCHNKQSWAIGMIGFAAWAPISMFAELWGIPFLEKAYLLSDFAAASLMKYIWIGIAIGGPVLGWLSKSMSHRKKPLIIGLVISLISSCLIIYFPINSAFLPLLLFIFGFAASCQCVTFGAIRDIHPLSIAGTAVGFNNMAVILGGVLCQPLIGIILESFWDNTWQNGVHTYSAHAYKMGFLLIPAAIFIGLISACFVFRETHGKKQY
jgi:MFS family permease